MTDQEGNIYKTVTIGTQVWMAENLRSGRYRNGDAIPNISDPSWKILSTGATCWYNNDSVKNHCQYGRLYNWFAVSDSKNLCPTGWHVPSDGEWIVLANFLGGQSVAGNKMKSTIGWFNNGNGTNSSGFSGRAGGYRHFADGTFIAMPVEGHWWSSSASSVDNAWDRALNYSVDELLRPTNNAKTYGFSVRCVKD